MEKPQAILPRELSELVKAALSKVIIRQNEQLQQFWQHHTDHPYQTQTTPASRSAGCQFGFRTVYFTVFIPLLLALFGCNQTPKEVKKALEKTRNRAELEKVLNHYKNPEDSLKLKAAHFLIGNMDEHYSVQGNSAENYDSIFGEKYIKRNEIINKVDSFISHEDLLVHKVLDIDVIKAEYLIENIEMSFRAWKMPWARHVNFEQFCEYILPYKTYNEPIENWRKNIYDKFIWVKDSLKDSSSSQEACKLINNDLGSWYFHTYYNFPFPSSAYRMYRARTGPCHDMANLAIYSMRAMGIPVMLDYTPYWANHSLGHTWNALLYTDGRIVNFMGAQNNPGMHKIEFFKPGKGIMRLKRAKVYRRTFAKQKKSLAETSNGESIPPLFQDKFFIDVTKDYLLTSGVTIKTKNMPYGSKFGYLCVFDNTNWQAIQWGKVLEDGQVMFPDMGRGIVYMPMAYKNETHYPLGDPFILDDNERITVLQAEKNKMKKVRLYRKYPIDESNTIQVGDNYMLCFWDGEWVSMGSKVADKTYLEYDVPSNALFWIRNLSRGKQERIFTIDGKGQQVWW